jgi:hypothetical protein
MIPVQALNMLGMIRKRAIQSFFKHDGPVDPAAMVVVFRLNKK